ncbi:hypothetical protein DFP73DRAFT_593343 [Morchella snyderi]|nr:hypothetical protein DFP73DRAFT_593343 [Morchella snyderi]
MLAARAVPRARLLLPPRLPTARPLSFLQSQPQQTRRPSLLFFRRHSPAPQTTPLPRHTTGHHPRLISAKTREYLLRESLIAARIVVTGYTVIFAAAILALAAALLHTEHTHPTAPDLPRTARLAITLARVITRFTPNNTWLAADILRDTAQRMPPWDDQSAQARRAYLATMVLLAELLEQQDRHAEARDWYQRVLATPRGPGDAHWADVKVGAALRASRIAAFMGDLAAAERALVMGVECTDAGDGATVEGLRARTELGVFYARCGRGAEALELFTRVLAARRAVAPPQDPGAAGAAEALGDPCAEAVTMAYIGEVVFSLGERRQGVAWSKEAYGRSEPLALLRGKCKECAVAAARNVAAMVRLMEEREEGEEGKEGKRGGKRGWTLFSGGRKAEEEEEKESLEEWERRVVRLESIRATKGA